MFGGSAAGAVLVLLFRDRDLLARHPYHGWHHAAGGAYRRVR